MVVRVASMTTLKMETFSSRFENTSSYAKGFVPIVNHNVFEQFVFTNKDGKTDASKILSRECYEAWLASKTSKPKSPEEAFRKALTAHCRGDEGMRPFEPKVEEAVLEQLRARRVWPCFQETGLKIGKRGYRASGYWEMKTNKHLVHQKTKMNSLKRLSKSDRHEEKTRERDGSQKKSKSKSKKQKKVEIETGTETESGSEETSQVVSCLKSKAESQSELLYPMKKSKHSSFKEAEGKKELKELAEDFDEFFDGDYELPIEELKDFEECSMNLDTEWTEVSTTFECDLPYFMSQVYILNEKLYGRTNSLDFEPPEDITSVFKSYKKKLTNEDIADIKKTFEDITTSKTHPIFKEGLEAFLKFTPESHHNLFFINLFRQLSYRVFSPQNITPRQELDDKTKYLFSKAFCLPDVADRKFSKTKTVGRLLGDSALYTPVDVDNNSRQIYRGCIVGVTALKLRVNKAQSIMHLQDIFIEFKTKGEVWTRSIEYRFDGTVMVLLNRYFRDRKDPSIVYVDHQDVTEDFFHYL